MKKVKSYDLTYVPQGSCCETEIGSYYIQNGTRLRIKSEAIKSSWRFGLIIKTNEKSLMALPIIGNLGFRNGTTFYSMGDGNYYLVEKNLKRKILDPKWFDILGQKRLDVLVASAADADLHKKGGDLD